MLMGLAVLLAGAFVDKWAAPLLALFNTLLFFGVKLSLAPMSDPRPSLLVFWWMAAAVIWLYERTLQETLNEAGRELIQRKKIETALRESEIIYQQAIEVSGAVPYRQSYRPGSNHVDYDFIGEGIFQITGCSPQDFNAPVWDSMVQEVHLLDDLEGCEWLDAVNRVRSGAIPVWRCEYRILARDGVMRWVSESGVELRDEHGVSYGSIGMFQDITQHHAAEERLRELSRRIVAAQEEERKRIAQELHDELGQALTAISLDLGSIEKALGQAASAEIRERLIETRRLANEVDEQIGELALNLRPSLLDDLGLQPTLKWYLNRFSQHLGIEVTMVFTGLDQRLSNEVEITLYRVVQEALTNVARHAQAGAVHLRLEGKAKAVVVDIQDDGRGFNVEGAQAQAVSNGSLGLFGIRDRVTTLGGCVAIQSEPGQGTRIHVEIPLGGQP
jgi:two-component system sensor histidine kinase UhpB